MKLQNFKNKPEYQLVIVVLCFLMIFLGLGFCSTCRNIFLSPITNALNIKRSAFSITDSIRFIVAAVLSIFYGSFIKRFGTKRLICWGLIFLIIACGIYSFAAVLPLFYLAGVFLGIGFSFTSTSMIGCVLVRWCHRNLGTITGIVLAANGFGSAIATQIFTPLIYEKGNPFGYRKAYLVMIALLIIVLAAFILFYKENPPVSYTNSKSKSGKSDKIIWDGLEFAKIKKSPYFVAAIICVFFTGLSLEGVYSISAAHMKDSALAVGIIASVFSLHSILLSISKIFCGFIYDKFGLRISVFLCDISSTLALISLTLISGSEKGKIFAFTYAVFSSLSLPLETIMLPIFTGDLFGMKSYNQVLGIFSAANTAGYAIGIPLVNLFYDFYGSYIPILITLCGVMFMVLIVFQLIVNKSISIKKGRSL